MVEIRQKSTLLTQPVVSAMSQQTIAVVSAVSVESGKCLLSIYYSSFKKIKLESMDVDVITGLMNWAEWK